MLNLLPDVKIGFLLYIWLLEKKLDNQEIIFKYK